MINKGTLFSGKRIDAPIQPSNTRPAGAAMTTVAPAAPANTPLPPSEVSTAAVPASDAAREAKLVVGPGVKLKGAEILDCDALVVEGRVEATMDSRLIEVADQGAFEGKVTVAVAEIRGSFRGEMTAREQLVIHATGRVSGKIRYGRIVVHEGGELSGDVRSLAAGEPLPVAEPVNLDSAGIDKILSAFPAAGRGQRSGTDQ